MSDTTTAAPASATAAPSPAAETPLPAAVAAPVAPAAPAAPAAPVVPAAVAEVQMTSAQLKTRLDEERGKAAKHAAEEAVAKVLKDLGVDKLDTAKAAVQKAKELEDAQKSEIEKAHTRATAAETKAARADVLEKIVAERLTLEEKVLTDDQREAVKRIAGEDPATRLRTIDALRPTWAAAAPVAPVVVPAAVAAPPPAAAAPAAQAAAPAAPAAPVAPAPLAPAASTLPANTAPPASPAAQPDHLRTLADLEKKNPFLASAYYFANRAEVDAARSASTARP